MIRTAIILAALALATPALSDPTGLIVCSSPGIIDGDTMACGDQRIRLWGIDAPERYTPAGPASTRALAEITTGQTLACKARGTSYQRTVAQCWIGKTDVAAEMVRRGHAIDYPKYSGGYYAVGGNGR